VGWGGVGWGGVGWGGVGWGGVGWGEVGWGGGDLIPEIDTRDKQGLSGRDVTLNG
jgi:hypothetical protein